MSEVENTASEAPAHLKNDKRFSDLMKQVTKFGEEAASGKDSLPKLAIAVVSAAADGVIDVETKNSKGDDAAKQIYTRYAATESKKALHEHTGTKANESKLRQLIAMGCMTTIDAVEVMQLAFTARNNMIGDDNKVKSAYPYYVDVAREQLKRPSALTQAELEQLAVKEEPKSKELEGELKRILKTLEGLVTGENKDKIKDTDDNTEAAYHLLKERVEKFATMRARAKLMADAAALGLNIA